MREYLQNFILVLIDIDNFMKKIALRIDDIGASTKKFEVYSKIPGGNFLFLKYMKPFKAWARYRELTGQDWISIFKILEDFNAKLTVGITAAWVEKNSSLIPFPIRFPDEAAVLKEGLKKGLIEIANHGLTHCVVGKHRPRLFQSNRIFHREFWDWLPTKTHYEHLLKSQDIMQNFFATEIVTLIPPGNVYCKATVEAAKKCNIQIINCQMLKNTQYPGIRCLSNDNVIAFHDRELVLNGIDWLKIKLSELPDSTSYCFIKEL